MVAPGAAMIPNSRGAKRRSRRRPFGGERASAAYTRSSARCTMDDALVRLLDALTEAVSMATGLGAIWFGGRMVAAALRAIIEHF